MRLLANRAREMRPMPPVAPVGNRHAERRSDAHVVHIMAIVLGPRNGNQRSAKQGNEANERSTKVPSTGVVVEDVQLTGQEEAQEAQAGKGKGRVAGGKRAPAVLQRVAVGRGADVDGDENVGLGVCRGLAAGEEVWSGAANGVFDDVCDEGGEDDGDGEGEVRGFVLVGGGAGDDVVGDEDAERDEEGV